MPVRPIRSTTVNEGSALQPTAWTSTPIPSLKDLQPKLVTGIPVIPELESPGTENSTRTLNKLPKMSDSNSKKPTYLLMVCEAIRSTGDVRKGSSVQSIKKWLIGHYGCEDNSRLNNNIKKALMKGTETGMLRRPKNSTESGSRGFFLLNKINPIPEKVKIKKEKEQIPKKPKTKVVKEVREPKKDKPSKNPPSKAAGTSVEEKPKKIPKAQKANKKESLKAENKVKSKESKKAAEPVKQKTKIRKPDRNSTDPDKTLVTNTTVAVPPANKTRNRRRKLSSAASDTEVTLIKSNLTDIVVNRMNFSDPDMSMIAKAELGRSIKTSTSSVKLKAKDVKSKQNRLSLKTSKILRKRGNPRASAMLEKNRRSKGPMRRSARNKNSTSEEASSKTSVTPQEMSADSIVIKLKRVPRRKSSV